MSKALSYPVPTIIIAVLSSVTILTFTLLVIPVHMGLSAGIAATSIITFSLLTLLSIALVALSDVRTRQLAVSSLITSVAGLLIPQLLYLVAARETNTSLRLNLPAYMRFNGDTELKPDSFHTYKTTEGQSLKLATYLPRSHTKGVVVLLHGGGWRYGNYLQTGNWPQTLTQAGYAAISVQYRLSSPGSPTWDKAPQDVHDALRYIQSHGSELGLDSSRLFLLGQSAGAHLALLEAYKNQTVSAVVSLYAPIDLALDYETSRDKSAELNFIGGTPEDHPERYRGLSPLAHIQPTSPATLVVQGARDDLVTEQNALLLSSNLKKHNVKHQTIILPLTGHSFENQHGGFATQITEQSVLNFLDTHF